jgi:hypothetical protein
MEKCRNSLTASLLSDKIDVLSFIGGAVAFNSILTRDDKFLMFQLASEGKTLVEIREAINNKVSKQRIYQILKKNGYNPAEIRRQEKTEIALTKKEQLYGSFFRDDSIEGNEELISLARAKFRQKKANALTEFTITFADIQWHTHCPILGIELDYTSSKMKDNSVSFDRKDNSKGYIPGNVIIISMRANRIKNDGTAEEHRLISNYMLQNNMK